MINVGIKIPEINAIRYTEDLFGLKGC